MAKRASASIQIEGLTLMKKRLRALEELDSPEITEALARIDRRTAAEVANRAPGSMSGKVTTKPAKKLGATIETGRVKHPNARSTEFGRVYYYRGYKGHNQKSGERFKVGAGHGQKARPFVGIKKKDAAIGALAEPIARELVAGVTATWKRAND